MYIRTFPASDYKTGKSKDEVILPSAMYYEHFSILEEITSFGTVGPTWTRRMAEQLPVQKPARQARSDPAQRHCTLTHLRTHSATGS